MSKEKRAGLLRQGVILLLLVTAVLLLSETGYFGGLREKLHLSVPEAASDSFVQRDLQAQKPADAVRPLAAVVCCGDGGRFGAAYDGEAVTAIFRRFSAELGEALGSAGAPAAMSEREFQDALSCSGVFLAFDCPQPLELLSDWLGTAMNGSAAAHRAVMLCLCVSGTQTELCYRTEDDDFFRCTTAVQTAGILNRTDEYISNGTQYAFENELLSGGEKFVVIPAQPLSAFTVKSAAVLPDGADITTLMRGVGMNSYVANSYTEADGTTVFVDEESTLRLRPDGSIAFRRTSLPVSTGGTSLPENVNTAWQIAEYCIGKSCGDAELIFAGTAEDTAPGSCTVWLDYAVRGVPVRLAGGHAVEIVLRYGTVVQLRLTCRSFTLTEQPAVLLPTLQAAAIAAKQGAEPKLIYADRGETAECIWVTD